MTSFYRLLMILSCVYLVYLLKTMMGINLSQRYHAADILKLPLKMIHAKK